MLMSGMEWYRVTSRNVCPLLRSSKLYIKIPVLGGGAYKFKYEQIRVNMPIAW